MNKTNSITKWSSNFYLKNDDSGTKEKIQAEISASYFLESKIEKKRCFLPTSKKRDQHYYGLMLKTTPVSDNAKEHKIIQVDKNSIAFKAGLQKNDIILEINSQSVELMDQKQVVKNIIDSDSDFVEILVTQK